MKAKLPWLRELRNFAGILVGIVMVAIGSVLFLNAILKIYILGFETSAYFNAEKTCMERVEPTHAIPESMKALSGMTEGEKEKKVQTCITRETQAEKKGYARRQKENMVEGFVLIVVGVPLWFIHRRRRKGTV